MTKFKCGDCGGTNVQAKAWVDPNTDEVIEFVEGDSEPNWCGDCLATVHLAEEEAPDPIEPLGRHLYQHIERAVKQKGTYEAKRIMFVFDEQLTTAEYHKVRPFLDWLHSTGKTIGSGNYEEVYAEYRKEVG